jgi:3-hydroxymyristoyl/3-hydroxydecanoyl-(acyl carrier protein) dehydratase
VTAPVATAAAWFAGPARWLAGRPPAVLVALTEAGLGALLAEGPAAVQVAALAAAGGRQADPDLEWRYALTEAPAAAVTDLATADRWLGRQGPDELVPVLTELGERSCRVVAAVPADLSWFRGHFPDAPILSGAYQLHFLIGLAARLANARISVTSVQQLKFSAPILPGMVIESRVQIGAGIATAAIRSAVGRHSSARLVYAVR